MNEQQPVAEPARRPFDVFDPKPYGISPYSLSMMLDAAERVQNALINFQIEMRGCTTPLALRDEADQAAKMFDQANEWANRLDAVRDIIELDLPLASRLPHGGDDEDGVTWAGQALPPSSIVKMNAMASELPLQSLTTYRRGVDSSAVPMLVKRYETNAKRAATRAVNKAAKAALAATEPTQS